MNKGREDQHVPEDGGRERTADQHGPWPPCTMSPWATVRPALIATAEAREPSGPRAGGLGGHPLSPGVGGTLQGGGGRGAPPSRQPQAGIGEARLLTAGRGRSPHAPPQDWMV